MITTLTPNPSLDRTLHVSRLERGEVLGVSSSTVESAGKGINVARALHRGGLDVTAVLPVGGVDGNQLEQGLAESGIEYRTVEITGSTRTNITVIESDGTVTKLNEPGPAMVESEVAALQRLAMSTAGPGEWLAMCGSLPPACPPDFYARLVQAGDEAGMRVAVDASGPALASAVEKAPHLIKPNLAEFRELVGSRVETLGEVVEASTRLLEAGVGTVLVSLGRRGAILADPEVVLYGFAELDEIGNTVGAGDAFLAGYLAGDGDQNDRLTRALAWANAAVRSPTTAMPLPTEADFACVTVRSEFDPAWLLEPLTEVAT